MAAGIISAIAGGAAAAAVAATRPDRYTAAASFALVDHVHTGTTVSLNRGILAEQTTRVLRGGTAGTIASRATSAKINGEWVTGPGFGEVSFTVESADPRAATAAATAVRQESGFLGYGLMPENLDQDERPALDPLPVKAAVPDHASRTKTLAAGVLFGGFAGFALGLLIAVPVRRPQTPEPA